MPGGQRDGSLRPYYRPHEAEWTPFQTHYFSEYLVALGIEPGGVVIKALFYKPEGYGFDT
jgi:hypothetical protein